MTSGVLLLVTFGGGEEACTGVFLLVTSSVPLFGGGEETVGFGGSEGVCFLLVTFG